MITAVVITAVAVILLLAAPITMAVTVERADDTRTTWRVRWLYGLLRLERRIESGEAAPPDSERTPQRAKKKPSAKRKPSTKRTHRSSAGQMVSLLRTPGLVARVGRLARELFGQVHVEGVYAHGTVGLEDPADTGELYGALAPVLATAWATGLDVECRADFERPGVRGTCGGQVWLRPLSVVWVVARFVTSRPVLRAAWAVLNDRRRWRS